MTISQHLLVEGRVQGVSFRFFTQKCAGALGIKGWVRNLDDGRVEVVAQGEPSAMEQFLARVKKGPMLAKVDTVKISKIDLKDAFEEFQIKDDSEEPWSVGTNLSSS